MNEVNRNSINRTVRDVIAARQIRAALAALSFEAGRRKLILAEQSRVSDHHTVATPQNPMDVRSSAGTVSA